MKNTFARSQGIARGHAHEHDVDELLGNDLANLIAKLLRRAVTKALAILAEFRAGRRYAVRHVGVFGVGEDEIAT